jgi:S-DNA-T family DNA segregation ATPase FtsK/SpoIIIE
MLLRGQGTYLSDDEINRVVDYVGTDNPQFAGELMQLKTKEELEAVAAGGLKNRDELYETAVDIVVRERRGSVSLLQRALGIGYGRAARLVDFMAEDGIVGEYNGSQAREVMISIEDWEAMSRQKADVAESAPTALPGGGQNSRPASLDLLQRNERITSPPAPAAPKTPRRNRIVPEPEEESELDDDDSVPFDVEDEDAFQQDDGELASASGNFEEEEGEEYEEESDASDDEWEEEDSEADESEEDEEEEDDDEADSEDADDEWDEEAEEEDELEEELTEK